jgi:hypothetical protein
VAGAGGGEERVDLPPADGHGGGGESVAQDRLDEAVQLDAVAVGAGDGVAEGLLLVGCGDGTRSVPAPLRETAAWLAALDPTRTEWLAEADPETLAGFSSILYTDKIRRLVVDGLLRRADEVELDRLPWARSLRRLQHPDLADQLRAALGAADSREPEDWPSWARVHLAVRLAGEAAESALAGPLLDLAENDAWGAAMRKLAARAALAADPDRAVPRLARILERLADTGYAAGVDSDDEFRGTLLTLLWPAHISTGRVLPHIRRRRNRSFFGAYLWFEHAFPLHLPEEDLAGVLRWASEQVGSGGGRPPQAAPGGDLQEHEGPLEFRPVGALDVEALDGIVGRALAGPTAHSRVDGVAALLLPRLRGFGRPPLPAALDVEDEHGREPATATNLRRAVAMSLMRLLRRGDSFNRVDAWVVLWGWGRSRPGGHTGPPAIVEGLRRANRGGAARRGGPRLAPPRGLAGRGRRRPRSGRRARAGPRLGVRPRRQSAGRARRRTPGPSGPGAGQVVAPFGPPRR